MAILAFSLADLLASPAVSVLTGVVAVIALLVFLYPDRAIFTRARSDVPMEEGAVPIVGHFFMALKGKNRARRLDNHIDLIKKYGPLRRVTIWPIVDKPLDLIFTNNPLDVEAVLKDPYTFIKDSKSDNTFDEVLGDGIFMSDGDQWKSARKLAANLFTIRGFRDFFSRDFIDTCDHLSEILTTASNQGLVVDIQDLLLRCTMDSFTRLAYGKDAGALSMKWAAKNGRMVMEPNAFANAFDTAMKISFQRGAKPLWWIFERLDGTGKQLKEAMEIIDNFAADVLVEKRKLIAQGLGKSEDDERYDLLDHLLKSTTDDDEPLSDKALRDHVLNFLLAGRDTTAQTLTWAFMEVSKRPEVARKLREEAMQAMGKDGKCTYDMLRQLPYTLAVFNEVLRLHANVPMTGKTVTQDTILPGSRIPVYKKNIVIWSSFAMGYSPDLWGEDYAEFRPERWLVEQGKSVMKQNTKRHFVFNGGPRICLGMNFAQQEGTVFLSTLIRRFDFELVNEDDPSKWGVYHPDPSKRQGRYDETVTLGLRGAVDFKLRAI
ncbi:cytochrome P450 [Gonapodya prolifera JEL478]|uniref:Cytochrome P450 n=1 Tax=Gonapodya prolifera (strain JEL478) TaxID=1344416 RepID=A0A139AXC5_GONPJ|nr:cytochrome P450 [Gonapodya prolifera JEL478]|eukprot:KXS21401.1 cytochrome P450 [Gonapodya prolifera JEL478]